MPLKEELEEQGNWLFRNRSWLPLVLFPLGILVLHLQLDDAYPLITSLSWCIFCSLVSFLGLIVRVITIGFAPEGTSDRNTSAGQLAESLNQSGVYSIVRHPLYLGNFFMWLGLFLYIAVWWFVIICCLAFWLYYERIMLAEEEFLRRKYNRSYEVWSSQTPAFIPHFRLWQSPHQKFSFRKVLKREHNGLLALAVTFSLFNSITHYFEDSALCIDYFWKVILIFSLIIFLCVRTLKKTTQLLRVEDQ